MCSTSLEISGNANKTQGDTNTQPIEWKILKKQTKKTNNIKF